MSTEPVRRRRLHPMVVVGALCVIAFLAEVGYQCTAVMAMPFLLRERLGLSMGVVGLMTMAFLISETVTKIPFGMLGDRYGRRWLVGGGPLLSAAAAFAATLVPGVWVIAAIRALDGAGGAMLWPALFTTVADVVEDRYRATAMSLFNIMYVGGLVGGPFLYSVVTSSTGSDTAIFWVTGSIFILCTLIGVLVTPPKQRQPLSSAGPEGAHSAAPPSMTAWGVVRSSPMLMTMLVLALVMFMGLHLLNGVLPIYLKEVIGVPKERIGHLFVGVGGVAAVIAIPLGRMGDRLGKPEAIRLGLAICAVGMWILPWVQTVSLLVVAAGFFGFGLLLATPAWLALMTEVAGEECRGGVVAIMNTSQGLGAALGAAVGGRLYDYAPHLPFLLSALLFSLTVAVAFRYVRPDGDRDVGVVG